MEEMKNENMELVEVEEDTNDMEDVYEIPEEESGNGIFGKVIGGAALLVGGLVVRKCWKKHKAKKAAEQEAKDADNYDEMRAKILEDLREEGYGIIEPDAMIPRDCDCDVVEDEE